MPDVLIGFSDGARRMSWWRTGLVTLALAIVTVAVGLGERAPDRAWWIAGFGVFSVIVFLGMVSGIYGRVVLTEEGMQFRTLFSRRSIPWSEIARRRDADAEDAEQDLVGAAGRSGERQSAHGPWDRHRAAVGR